MLMKLEVVISNQHLLYWVRAVAKKNHYPGCALGSVTREGVTSLAETGYINHQSGVQASNQSFFRIASMSKSFVAMAILQLRDKGLLRLDDAAEISIPELANLAYPRSDDPPITIENLLTMTAGFPEDNRWADRKLDESESQLLALINEGLSFAGSPNQAMEYSNLSYALLGLVIKRITGQSYQSYIAEHIFKPLGMVNTCWEYDEVSSEQLVQGYRLVDPELEAPDKWQAEPLLHDGAWGAIGGIITSIEEFALYMQFLLSAYDADADQGKQSLGPLSRESVLEMGQPRVPWHMYPAQPRDADLQSHHYGYGLEVRKDRQGLVSIGHAGALPGFGSYFHFYPTLGFGVMLFTNLSYGPGMMDICDQISTQLMQMPPFKQRLIAPSTVLTQRQVQLIALIKSWDKRLDRIQGPETPEEQGLETPSAFLADNFYQDESPENRYRQLASMLDNMGDIKKIEAVVPINALRGTFLITGTDADLELFFSLTPEQNPKVQMLTYKLKDKGQTV